MRWLAVTCVAWSVAAALGQDLPCKNASVRYEKPTPEITASVKLSPVSGISAYSGEDETAKSLQGTHWLSIIQPDYIKPGPWNTTLLIGNRSSKEAFLRIDVLNHGNTFRANWLNDKLVFVDVWWGRIYASDIIVDVEKRQIVYHELASYAEMTFCKEQ